MHSLRQLHDVDLKLLRIFCTIVEEGSFTAAQVTLNLSQSALSEYLKTLEIRLGTRLCQRGPRGFKLHREGEIVYKAACELFRSIETFKQRAADLNGGAGCELSVAIEDALIEHPKARISEAISRFTEYYPAVTLRLETMYGLRLAGRIADGSIDVGICAQTERLKSLPVETLFEEEAELYCGRGHPLFAVPEAELTLDRIASAAYCHREHFEHLRGWSEPHWPLGDIGHGAHAQLALIVSGRNVGYVPRHIAAQPLRRGLLRALRPDVTRTVNSIVAVSPRTDREFRVARNFLDCLVESHLEDATQPTAPAMDRKLRVV